MKRNRLLFVSLVWILMAAFAACAPAVETASPSGTPEVVMTQAPEYLEIPVAETAAPTVSGEGPFSAKIEAMRPVLDSLVHTMGVGEASSYRPDDPDFVWSYLYLMGVNFGELDARCTLEDSWIRVPAVVLQEYALVGLNGLAELPALPDSYSEAIAYDASTDSYRMQMSDSGESEPRIMSFARTEDGSITVSMGLYCVEDYLGGLTFALSHEGSGAYPLRVAAGAPAFPANRFAPETDNAVDLDGDGQDEIAKITITDVVNDSVQLTLIHNGETYTEDFEYLYNVSLYAGDLDSSDGAKELYLCGDVASSDYCTYVYRIGTDGKVERTELWGQVIGLGGDGTLLLEKQVDILGTYSGFARLRRGADGAYSEISPFHVWALTDNSRLVTVAKDGLPITRLSDGSQATLNTGDQVSLVYTDLQSYAVVECNSGDLVRIDYSKYPDPDMWGWMIAGEDETKWFSDAFYCG